MLSYMLPVDEKPPPAPDNTKTQLRLTLSGGTAAATSLANGTTISSCTPISKETSISSFASDATTATISHSSMTPSSTSDRLKPKITVNGGKHQTLKRVSFGSSKGSMVETLIYESPLQEESEPSPVPEMATNPFPEDHDQTEAERERVRVSFFQQSKPQEVDLPDETILYTETTEIIMATNVLPNEGNHVPYNRTQSTESGWENPFRPGGDLSREADEIVELIKEGKPITPTPGSQAPPLPSVDEPDVTKSKSAPITQSPKSVNGNCQPNDTGKPGAVDIQRGTVVPASAQVEHVTIKKKPKCKCCVIQ